MITLERTRTISVPFMNAAVAVSFNIPTAEEVETTIRASKDIKDTDLFRAFVTKVSCPDIEGWADGLAADAVTVLPGTFPLVNKTALEIMQSAFLSEAEKN